MGGTYKLWMEVVTRPEKRYYFSIRPVYFRVLLSLRIVMCPTKGWDRPERLLPFAAKPLGLQTELAQSSAEKTQTRTSCSPLWSPGSQGAAVRLEAAPGFSS